MGAGATTQTTGTSSGPNYKFTYFNFRGRAETVRLCFAAGGIPYNDNRIVIILWPFMKSGTPWGTLPILEVDGVKYGQSMAIARYVAKEADLIGKDSFEQALIDSATDQITDLREKAVTAYFKKGKEKEAAYKDLKETTLPTILGNLQRFAETNQVKPGFFVSDKISLADLHLYSVIELVQVAMPDPLHGFPTLQKIFEAVAGNQKVSEYLKIRPKTAS